VARTHELRFIITIGTALALGPPVAACGDDGVAPNPPGGDAGSDPDAGPLADSGPTDSGDAGPADGGGRDAPIEIAGVWASNFGTQDVITKNRFNDAAIRTWNNDRNFVITQNPPTAGSNPNRYNRVVWTEFDGERFFYCIVDFGLESLEAALDSDATADDSDPVNTGCGGFPWTRLREAIGIRGRYVSNFGGVETVTATAWKQGGPAMHIADWSDDERWAVTQNDEDAEFAPGRYNRIVWTETEGDEFYYCFVDFGLRSLRAALESDATADDSDPENRGCGGFPWTRLREAIDLRDTYVSNFDGVETITATSWRQDGPPMRIADWSNEERWAVTRNGEDADFNPGLFNRIVWTDPEGDRFYYCFVDFGLDSLRAALDSEATADDSDPETRGCGGFPWTRLREAVELRGDYTSNFGGTETITATTWRQAGPPMRIVEWNEDERWIVTQNDARAEFDPSRFNRIETTRPDREGSFFYCFVDFGLVTAEEAIASTMTADASDPSEGGCGGFPWTRLDRR